MDVAIYTLGCKVNQYETQAMEQELLRRGHTLADCDGPADAYIINTCTVTAVSDKKCRNILRRARKTPRTRWWPCAAATLKPTRSPSAPWGLTWCPARRTGWRSWTGWRNC